MIPIIVYILKVVAIHGILYLLYWLALRKSARHSVNRAYLLIALVIAFVIPFIEIPLTEKAQTLSEESPLIIWLSEPSVPLENLDLVPVKTEQTLSWWLLIPIGYGLLAIVLLIRLMTSLLIFQKLKKHSKPIKKRWFKLFKTSHGRPFSFFSNVFIPGWLFGTNAFDSILAHECVHVRQYHSVDRLLVDFVVSLFWFNPFIYLYRNALIEIHEYQADEAVIKRFDDPIGYQEILFSQLQTASHAGLVSHFNVEMIKKRILMMNKPKKMTGWVYALTVPVTLFIVFAFSSKEATAPLDKVGEELSAFIGPFPDLKAAALTLAPKDNVPSILPLKNTDKLRMSSGFGRRMDPFAKKYRHHRGMDFATPTGNPILATADGEVTSARDEGKFGLRIIIKHDESYTTAYAHLSAIDVKKGQIVKKGEQIGLSGNTGLSTKDHLHYEVMKDGKYVNPANYIKNYTFEASLREHPREYGETQEQQDTDPILYASLDSKPIKATPFNTKSNISSLVQEQPEDFKKQFTIRKNSKKVQADSVEPLFVVDGEIQSRPDIKDMNPEQIKEIQVLKGVDAIAQYGAKAINGVVVITTKGKKKVKTNPKVKVKVKKKQEAYKVIIDPGHGGTDQGAVSPSGNLEKEVSLKIAKLVKEHFKKDANFEIILTRSSDKNMLLVDRPAIVKEADLFISLHTDNYSGEGSFIFPVYHDGNEYTERSQRLAKLLAYEFEEAGKETKVGYSTGYRVLKEAKCPAVLLNVGFFSDPEEDAYLGSANGQKEIANEIADAIKLAVL